MRMNVSSAGFEVDCAGGRCGLMGVSLCLEWLKGVDGGGDAIGDAGSFGRLRTDYSIVLFASRTPSLRMTGSGTGGDGSGCVGRNAGIFRLRLRMTRVKWKGPAGAGACSI